MVLLSYSVQMRCYSSGNFFVVWRRSVASLTLYVIVAMSGDMGAGFYFSFFRADREWIANGKEWNELCGCATYIILCTKRQIEWNDKLNITPVCAFGIANITFGRVWLRCANSRHDYKLEKKIMCFWSAADWCDILLWPAVQVLYIWKKV